MTTHPWQRFASSSSRARGRSRRRSTRLEQLRDLARAKPTDEVLCHTDIWGSNLILDDDGALHLLDWNGARIAPPEADLFMFAGTSFFPPDRFGWFLERYEAVIGRVGVDPDRLGFYLYRRDLEDLALFVDDIVAGRTDLMAPAATLTIIAELLDEIPRLEGHIERARAVLRARWRISFQAPMSNTTEPSAYDVAEIRAHFPALAMRDDGRAMAFFDGPGGTQVPRAVIEAVAGYYETSNANEGGAFLTSHRSDAMTERAHEAVAEFLNARSGHEIKFGANMTTLTFHISRSIGKTWRPGDEIVVTTLDHEANVSPWRAIAEDRGVTVRTVDIHPEDGTLDLDDLSAKLSDRTRLVAVGYASNALGTINPVGEIIRRAHAAGALAYIDAVHFAPHGPIDVQALDADFLVCSAYKFFGPHLGALYGKEARARRAAGLQGAAGARPLRDRDAEPGGHRRDARRGRLPGVGRRALRGAVPSGVPGADRSPPARSRRRCARSAPTSWTSSASWWTGSSGSPACTCGASGTATASIHGPRRRPSPSMGVRRANSPRRWANEASPPGTATSTPRG